MLSQEERLAELEQRVADIELERLYEKRKGGESTPSEQAYDVKQINHRLTMLLGVTSGQEKDIKAIKNDLESIKKQISDIKQDNAEFYIRFDRVNQRFEVLESHLHSFEQGVNSRFEAQDQKLDAILALLKNNH